MPKGKRQLWRLRESLIRMRDVVRWDQVGMVGMVVARFRARLERAVEKIDRRLMS